MDSSVTRRYLTTTKPGAHAGAATFILSNSSKNLKRKQVLKELKKLKSYRLHAPAYKNFPRRRVYVSRLHEQWAMDLVDIQSYSRYNFRQKYLLVVLDVFSKKAWIEAIPNKTGPTVTAALDKIILRTGVTPEKIQSDRGKEFYNKFMNKMLTERNIKLFSVYSDLKCCVIERFIRTLFGRIARHLTDVGGKRFVNVLPDIEHSYNNSYHRSIKMKPSEVTLQNSRQVHENLYGNIKPILYKSPKFNVGDFCLIAKRKTIFEKGYAQSYLHEIFKVKKIRQTTPHVYELVDLNEQLIKGVFYEKQMLKL